MSKGNVIVVDSDACIRQFRLEIAKSPALTDHFQEYPEELPEFCSVIFQYIADRDTAEACLHEFAMELREMFCSEFSDVDLEALSKASLQLGLSILALVNNYRLYDTAYNGWYRCDRLLGNDLVLEEVAL